MEKINTKSFILAVYARGNESSEKIALVLPGKLDTKDYPHMRSHVDFLANQGFFALSFDPPGTWESPGGIELYTMTNYLKAINELIGYFGNKPTILLGHSRGGSMAMLGAITSPYVTHFVAVMSRAGERMPNKPMKAGDTSISYRDMPGSPNEKKKFELPFSYFEDSARYNILEGLKSCTKSKLFIMGTRDITVKPEEVKAAYEAAAQPKEFREIDSDHDYRWHSDLIDKVNQIVGDFLSKREK
ncbi:MAG: alpha/beta fold hydrolase [Candidatus Pacebacteria bacterium]|nr:alpha/beta fold hydrolase [Candidatus Paceibacterota bacterium]